MRIHNLTIIRRKKPKSEYSVLINNCAFIKLMLKYQYKGITYTWYMCM